MEQSKNKKGYCIACIFKNNGVKTRKNISHTCVEYPPKDPNIISKNFPKKF